MQQRIFFSMLGFLILSKFPKTSFSLLGVVGSYTNLKHKIIKFQNLKHLNSKLKQLFFEWFNLINLWEKKQLHMKLLARRGHWRQTVTCFMFPILYFVCCIGLSPGLSSPWSAILCHNKQTDRELWRQYSTQRTLTLTYYSGNSSFIRNRASSEL